jgi:hypothetical protein
MKYLKVAGIAWGLIYFVVGALKSFTLGSNDFWTGAAFFLATFLLPLPIAIVAVWFPKTAGGTLFVCVAVSVSAAALDLGPSHFVPNLANVCIFLTYITLYNLAALVFAVAYIKFGRASKNADSGDEGSSVGVA